MTGDHIGDNITQFGNGNIGKMDRGSVPSGSRVWPRAAAGQPIWMPSEPLVFVNYRNTDDKAATYIDAELTRRLGEGAVFRAGKMAAGTAFPDELITRAGSCKVMISVIGEKWDNTYGLRLLDDPSDWVRREIATALAHGVHVAPVLVGARRRPDANDLPEDIRRIAFLQQRHLRRGYDEQDVCRLVDELLRDVPVLAQVAGR